MRPEPISKLVPKRRMISGLGSLGLVMLMAGASLAQTSTLGFKVKVAVQRFTLRSSEPGDSAVWVYLDADPLGAARGWFQVHWVPARKAVLVSMGVSHNYSADNSVRLYDPATGIWTTLLPHGDWTLGTQIHNRDSAPTFFIPSRGSQGEYWVMGGVPQIPHWGGIFNVAQARWTRIASSPAELFAGLVDGAGAPATDGATAWCPSVNSGLWWGGNNGATLIDSGEVIEPNPGGPEPYRSVWIPPGGPEPRWRIVASAVCVGNTVYLYGGAGLYTFYLNDLWKFHIPSRTWTQLASGGPGGPDIPLTYDPVRNILVAAGRKEPIVDTVYATYDIATNTWSPVIADPFAPSGGAAGAYAPTTGQSIFMNGWSVHGFGNSGVGSGFDERADFDADGQTDLVWQHAVTGQIGVWFMAGITQVSATLFNPGQVADTNWKIRNR
jgi:Galactose oxidase, central domain